MRYLKLHILLFRGKCVSFSHERGDFASFSGEGYCLLMKKNTQDQRIQLVASSELIGKVDDWRRKQPDIPSRSEAIRRLIAQSLNAGD